MSFKNKVLITVLFACLTCTMGAIIIASMRAEQMGYQSLKNKSTAILSRLEASRTFIANQGLLQDVIRETVKDYPN